MRLKQKTKTSINQKNKFMNLNNFFLLKNKQQLQQIIENLKQFNIYKINIKILCLSICTLQYGNDEGQIQQYNVIIYSAPWNGQDQITKCEQINGHSASFTQNQVRNNQIDEQPRLIITKPSLLRLKVRKQDQANNYSTGTWENINPEVFEQSNENIINQANIGVAQQYNPSQQGYEFDEVLEVQTQMVSGTNYNIKLLYSNGEGSYQTYDVYLYICPWNSSANQLTGTYSI